MTASEDIDNLVIVPPEKPLKMRAQPIMPPRVKRMWQKLWLKPREERREADWGRNGAGGCFRHWSSLRWRWDCLSGRRRCLRTLRFGRGRR